MIERTLILVKPDGVKRGLIGEVLKRFEQRGLKIIGLKLVWIDGKFAKRHYTEDIGKKHGMDVWKRLLDYIKEGPVIAAVLEGVSAIENVRKICGNTYPHEALPGTIRGDYCHISKHYANENKKNVKNIVHASGNKEDAKKEIKLWFSDSELVEYKLSHEDELR